MARVRAVVPFTDRECNRTRAAGHVFSCSDERAEKLIELGLAEDAGDAAPWPPVKAETRPASGAEDPDEGAEGAPAGDSADEPTRAQLLAQAEELGVTVPSKANKNKIKELIADALEVREAVLG